MEIIEDLALELGCKVEMLPSIYLNLPLEAPFKPMTSWDVVEERFGKRLAMWKDNTSLKEGESLYSKHSC